jgi:NADH dehydrogenase
MNSAADRMPAEVTLVNGDAFHNIRVRNYEADLTPVRIPLDDVLGPVGVRCVEGTVVGMDWALQAVTVDTPRGKQTLSCDRLVFALGSQLLRPHVPGLAEYAFEVDTYGGAAQLDTHLQSLPSRPESPGQFTVVVGAGLTGIEAGTEMPGSRRRRGPRVRPAKLRTGDRVGARLGRHHLEAFLAAQQFAFRLAAVLGLVGAVISVLRGAEVPVAPRESHDPVERIRDGQKVGGASRAELRAAMDHGGIG